MLVRGSHVSDRAKALGFLVLLFSAIAIALRYRRPQLTSPLGAGRAEPSPQTAPESARDQAAPVEAEGGAGKGDCGPSPGFTEAPRWERLKASRDFLRRIPRVGGFGSHLVPLASALLLTDGPIIEMGTGAFSTELVHNATLGVGPFAGQSRTAISADTDRAWLGKFTRFESPQHKLEYVPVYAEGSLHNVIDKDAWDRLSVGKWSVAFIDQRPGERRKVDLRRLRCSAEILLAHDTETAGYGYAEIMGDFRYKYAYKFINTHTTLFSNFFDLAPLDAFFQELNADPK